MTVSPSQLGLRKRIRKTLAVFLVLFGGGVAVWHYLNTAPAYTMPHPPLPTPNAYDYYARAGKLIQAIPKADRKKAFDPKTPIPGVAAVVDQCQPAFRLVRQGTAYRYATPLPRTARAVWHYDLRYLLQFGELSQLLIAESRVAAAHGDYESALRSIKDCIRLGIAIPHGGIEADTINGLSMENYGLVELVFQARNLNARDSQKAAQWLGALDKNHIAWSEMQRMQWGFMREVLPIIAQDPQSLGIMEPGYWMFRLWNLRGAAREVGVLLAQVAPQADLPAGKRAPLPPFHHPFMKASLKDYEFPLFRYDAVRTRYRLLEIELALRAYRLKNGKSAPSLEALVPEYLPAVPQDPFGDGGPLCYHHGATTFAYSVGPDRKDDGGQQLRWGDAIPERSGDLLEQLGQRDEAFPCRLD